MRIVNMPDVMLWSAEVPQMAELRHDPINFFVLVSSKTKNSSLDEPEMPLWQDDMMLHRNYKSFCAG